MSIGILNNLKRLSLEGFFLTIPDSVLIVIFALLFTGFKEKITLKRITIYALLAAVTDILSKLLLEKFGVYSFLYILLTIIYTNKLFKIDFISSTISQLISLIFAFIFQTIHVALMSYLLNIDFNQLISSDTNFLTMAKLSYTYFIVASLFALIIYKFNFTIIDLNKHKLLSKLKSQFSEDFIDNVKITLLVLTPIIVFITLNYSIFYYQAFNKIETSSILYLTLNSAGLIISNIIMIYLIRRIINLRYYKLEWKTQQNYLHDVDQLLNRLRAQKHGFINHMNIIFGLISLGEYNEAKEYLSNIHETISTKDSFQSVGNPTLDALLTVKQQIAESKNIRFDINIDKELTHINFKAFEIGEAIGNIIDNAIEAILENKGHKGYIKINIFTRDNHYVFEISNSGKNIPPEILEKIFDEGFSTKKKDSADHGFGLYISKNIIEYYRGKIEVESKDNLTTFRIMLPKVVQNEFKAS